MSTRPPARRREVGQDLVVADLVDIFSRSIDQLGARIAAVRDDQWSAPTPCSEWDVRTLVNHVTGEQLWAPHLVAGETIEQVGDRYDGDVLGADPAATWRHAAPRSVAAFAGPGALDRTVHLSYGDESCREYLTQMLTDAAVHGWDLARATGQDETIDPEAVDVLLEAWSPRRDLLAASGVFAAPVEVDESTGAQARLLALLGRRP
jgi:uncharacterized protein (TIGR03086 family)